MAEEEKNEKVQKKIALFGKEFSLKTVGLVAAAVVIVGAVAAGNANEQSDVQSADPATSQVAEEPVAEETVEPTPEATPTPTQAAEPEKIVYHKLSTRKFKKLFKDPDAHAGEHVLLYVRVDQLDSATGPCLFRAISYKKQLRWWNLDGGLDGMFASGDATSNCPVYDDVVQDDELKVWATVVGAYTYDTAIGGSNTVPLFLVEKVKHKRSLG